MGQSPPGVFEKMLAMRIGLDPSSVGEDVIGRAVRKRMASLGLRLEADYERVVLGSDDEWQALVEELVIPESWFFRDLRPFEVLTDLARNGWVDRPDRATLTVLSLPCAGGEEPYSIALTLLRAGLPVDRFRVDGVDLSARSLSRAIAGVYGRNAFRGAGSTPRASDFVEKDGIFTLRATVRSAVRFHQGNLLDPALFADRPSFDVVFCRNLLIYLDPEARVRALANLDRLVADGGLLFVGHADRLDQLADPLFRPTSDKGAFAYRKGREPQSKPKARPAPALPRARPVDPPRPSPPSPPPALIVRRPTAEVPLPAREESLLDRASKLADLGRYDEAKGLVDRAVLKGESNPRAFFLLGLIAQASGDYPQAEAHFAKAIYLDPQHDEALMALALQARRRGDIGAEVGFRKRAERVLSRKALTS